MLYVSPVIFRSLILDLAVCFVTETFAVLTLRPTVTRKVMS